MELAGTIASRTTPVTGMRHTGVRHNRAGAATVEFAILMAVLVIVLMGALEVGCAFHTKSALQNAAREGARRSIIPGATMSSVTAACETSLEGTGIESYSISITPNPESANPGAMITVEIVAGYSENSWLPTGKWLGGVQLSSSVVMRKE